MSVKEESIEDAIIETELLRNAPHIDHDKIFIIGHSMGAMLDPRIEFDGVNYKGLILLSGTLRKIEKIKIYPNKDVLNKVNKLQQWIIKDKLKRYLQNLILCII